jgi:3-(3-hydroxy-phenyl)propionate hydroxylase
MVGGNHLFFEEVVATNKPVRGPVSAPPGRTEVTIVGAGPIGLLAANLLGLYGVKTLLIERSASSSDQPKAVIMDDEFLRLIDRLELLDELRPHLTSVPFGIHFYSPLGFTLVKAEGFVTLNGFPNRNSVSQPMLEKILLQGAQRFDSVTICYERSAAAISQTSDWVQVRVEDNSGREIQVSSRFVLGCDGVHSFVRTSLDIGFEGVRLNEPHLVIDLAEFPDQSPFSRFFCNPRRPFNSILMPYGGRRIEFMLIEGDDREHIKSFDSIKTLVERHTPYAGIKLKVIRSAVYGYSARIAERLQNGRVFLLGDAAHVMPPFGSSGMNTGARDAHNLCWKLAAVLHQTAAAGVLDSYDAERRPQIESVVKYSVRVGRLANIRSWPAAILRDALFAIANLFPFVRRYFREMRYMPRPRIEHGMIVPDHRRWSLVGRMFPRLTLRGRAGGCPEFDELCGAGFALIGVDVGSTILAQVAALPVWAKLRPAVLAVRLTDRVDRRAGGGLEFFVEDARQRRALSPHSGEIVIIRPDRYVAAAATVDDIVRRTEVIARTIGLLPSV